ncbi:hypothetical protein HANVADRAFT_52356 [Hanseniaspora valbyensis NRRL Y-1626]|uniref:MINDY deubiquitinase domain-containing protein n=1 Tax=Hanseniaspora valbyensis NRRL Y-1626 TaxID=766949 RepID=A0A1B7TEZ2_9ASCO|nr:hypothetical protein HANVADRAFT_52356 [Hanseniaspora valbyensis NRRL Y-1626]
MKYTLKQILLPFENAYQNVIVDTEETSKGLSTLANTLVISPNHRSLVQDLVDVLNDNIEIDSDLLITHLISIAQFFNPQNNINADFLRTTLNKFAFEKSHLDPVFDGTFKINTSGDEPFSSIELSIFELYQLTVVHMWVTDDSFIKEKSLKDTQAIIMQGYSLNKNCKINPSLLDVGDNRHILDQYNSVKSFLASSATQFTEFGLQLAQKKLNAKDVVIFYKNEQFQILLKGNDGIMYILSPILDSDLNWRSLKSVNGTDDDYLNSLQQTNSSNNNFRNGNAEQQLSDEEFARQLQMKEDAKYAQIINGKDTANNKQDPNNKKYIAKKQKQVKQNQQASKSKKKSKKCVIM